MILSNTGPLIYLAKIRKLQILKVLFKEITIPKQVYEEIIRGKEDNFLDAFVVEKAVKNKWIKIEEIKINAEIEEYARELDIGEIALISLAKKLKPSLILIDDASARTIAGSFGFNVIGTLYVLLKAYKNKLFDKTETKKLVNELIFSGFRISQEVYIQFLDELEKD